jgi:hypothetical protein
MSLWECALGDSCLLNDADRNTQFNTTHAIISGLGRSGFPSLRFLLIIEVAIKNPFVKDCYVLGSKEFP